MSCPQKSASLHSLCQLWKLRWNDSFSLIHSSERSPEDEKAKSIHPLNTWESLADVSTKDFTECRQDVFRSIPSFWERGMDKLWPNLVCQYIHYTSFSCSKTSGIWISKPIVRYLSRQPWHLVYLCHSNFWICRLPANKNSVPIRNTKIHVFVLFLFSKTWNQRLLVRQVLSTGMFELFRHSGTDVWNMENIFLHFYIQMKLLSSVRINV